MIESFHQLPDEPLCQGRRIHWGRSNCLPQCEVSLDEPACEEISKELRWLQPEKSTCRNFPTFCLQRQKISLTSRETVTGWGIWTHEYSIRNISWSSSSATMLNGQCRRAHYIARRNWKRAGEYVVPFANAVICHNSGVSAGLHFRSCSRRFFVESS
jgi:hypothetical protein